ncbi:hypothetical protein AVEN_49337-1 [Araneus ventricosus]|uniref:Uncharacterized protein n=1 Tax=Araneus ventricosus TaxID=182803 RepID=A0A4Y2H731_ARAVE|nr:hypothetical protein AVEN_49337-1 [Araneus ventricosus]
MNMNTELLRNTLDEIFEETDSEDYNENESEMEELETEVSEDTERWSDDGDFKKNPFEGNPGPGIFTLFCHTRKFDREAGRLFFTSNYSEEQLVHMVFNHLICTK